MRKTNKHIIQRQTFEMRGYSRRPGFEWEQRVAEHHRNIIMPGIEACFDAVPEMDEHLVIDSIDIDLGVFTHESFVKEGRERLMRLLGEHLQECRRKAAAVRTAHLPDVDERTAVRPPVPAERVFSEETAAEEALLYFLKTGVLPWWFAGTEELFTPSAISADMLELLHGNDDAVIRAVRHFPDEMMLSLLERVVKNIAAVEQEWHVFAKVAQQFPSIFPAFRQRYWTVRLREKKEVMEKETVLHLFTPFGKKFVAGIYAACVKQRPGKHFGIYASLLKPTGILKQEEDEEEKILRREEEKKNPHETNEAHQHENTPSTYQTNRTDEQNSTEAPHHQKNVPGEALYVHAAGIILLHPFLAELFSSTGLWKENRWTSQASSFKAVQLLSYLTYGPEEVPEYKLTFHKILAGMDAATPLPPEAPLLPEETATCTELLEAVLRHWTALRSTGVDGLREGFLLRSGKVQQTQNGLQLDMERLAQDVLLARLPWGYSTVKLPWLEPLLTVNWI